MSEHELNQIIANNIAQQLSTRNITQLELAEYMHVSQATVSNWCKGIKIPRMNKIDQICKFFDIERSDLLEDHTNDKEYYTNKETAKVAQEIFENKDLRMLFDTARDAKAEDLKTVHSVLLALKKKERGED